MACAFRSTLPVASKLLNQEMSQCLIGVKWGVGVKFGIGHFNVTARFMHLMHVHDNKWHSIYTDKQSLHNEGQILQVENSGNQYGRMFVSKLPTEKCCLCAPNPNFLVHKIDSITQKATQFVPPSIQLPVNQLTIHCLKIWHP